MYKALSRKNANYASNNRMYIKRLMGHHEKLRLESYLIHSTFLHLYMQSDAVRLLGDNKEYLGCLQIALPWYIQRISFVVGRINIWGQDCLGI